jgi:septum formation protein
MLYLASQSPRRRALLRRLRRPFRVVRTAYREAIRLGETAAQTVRRNAAGKARRARLPRAAAGIVIGADTVLWFRDQVLGKPKTVRQARALLRAMQGTRHWVYTGVCLMDVRTRRCRLLHERSRVTFRRLPDETLERLLGHMAPLDKAGGYAAQRDSGRLIARIEGSRANVIGLPLERLRRELAAFERGVNHA